MSEKIIALLGGDLRELEVLPALKSAGFTLQVYALPKNKVPVGVEVYDTAAAAMKNAEVVILPLPAVNNEGRLHSSFFEEIILTKDDFSTLEAKTPVLVGVCSNYLREISNVLDLQIVEVAEMDEIAIPNAIPTAEATLELAMKHTDITVAGMKILLLGYGRVGEAVAKIFKALGAEVTVTNRGDKRFAAAAKDGFAIYPWDFMTDVLPKVDLLINTVPAKILDREKLQSMQKNIIIIDLASGSGGVDFQAAGELGIKAIHALSLPGKVAPKTAGQVLAAVYPKIIKDIFAEKNKYKTNIIAEKLNKNKVVE